MAVDPRARITLSSFPPQADADSLFESVARSLEARGAYIPGATYRIQLGASFTFDDALRVVPYLRDLGITDLFASPFFRARAQSSHGYDVVDQNAFHPPIGDRDAFNRLSDALAANAMGLVLDVVPNHMGIASPDNTWWSDVLEHGPASIYASFFDVDWSPLKTELRNKVLLPMLGDHYGHALENGDITLAYAEGAFAVRVYGNPLPVNPQSYPAILAPCISPLASELGEEHDAVLEFQSIVTGFTHLPPCTETQRSKRIERRRESQILKRRLGSLVSSTPLLADLVASATRRFNGAPGDPRSFDPLDALLEQQSYRLSFWRVAAEEVNYRRFFDINDLAAIRIENPAVFVQANKLLFELLGEGRVSGLRVDHPDGLWDPSRYFGALQRRYFVELCRRRYVGTPRVGDEANRARFESYRSRIEELHTAVVESDSRSSVACPLFTAVEKILSRGERLPTHWSVHGTSGYDFANLVTDLLVDSGSERALTVLYEGVTGRRLAFEALVYANKKLILHTSLSSELHVLAHFLERIAARQRYSRDFTLTALTEALIEVIASFPVYRTYITDGTEAPDAHDRGAIERAIRLARRRNPTTDASIFGFIRALLVLDLPTWIAPGDRDACREFVMRFQQLTGPVMAKGVEDTAFYVYNRFVCLNEVGGEPERFGTTVAAYHRAVRERSTAWPSSMNATSTHDTKRSEDVRARMAVLSELPGVWSDALEAFESATLPFTTEIDGQIAPDANERYLLHQTFVGCHPVEPMTSSERAEFIERMVMYARKATKEAKVNTSWMDAEPDYDAAVEAFVRRSLGEGSALDGPLRRLLEVVAPHGYWNSLTQTLLKFTAPGVPDTYQGNELWDWSLVDPDNRHAVDFAVRARLLDEIRRRRTEGAPYLRELLANARDGRIKLFVTHVALMLRHDRPELFDTAAEYVPLEASGTRARHVVAFARSTAERTVVVLAPRLTVGLSADGREAPTGEVWADTRVEHRPGTYVDAFSGTVIEAVDGVIEVAKALGGFPVGALVRQG